jgi:hypothetical protein
MSDRGNSAMANLRSSVRHMFYTRPRTPSPHFAVPEPKG